MIHSKIKNKFLIKKPRKNNVLEYLLRKKSRRKNLNLSKRIFYTKYNLFKNKQNIKIFLNKKQQITNRKTFKSKHTLNNSLLWYLCSLKEQEFEKNDTFYETKTLFLNFYLRFILFYFANEYSLINLVKNINNYPYSILIVYLNCSIRFWSILKKLLYIFISQTKISRIKFEKQVFNLHHLNLEKKFKSTIGKNQLKSRLWEIKTNILKLKLPSNLIKSNSTNEFYNYIKINKKKLIKCDRKWHYFHKKKTRFLLSNKQKEFNSKKISVTKIKNHLWKMNRKLYTQNSFNWLFKKYWLLVASYKASKINKSKNRKFKMIFKTKNFIFFKNVFKKQSYNYVLSTYYLI